jgi:CRP/FNR family transcriptional regulator, nitrogen oxide reductase regulator
MIDSQTALSTAIASEFLAGLEPAARERVLASAQMRSASAKSAILTGGQPAAHLFLLLAGRVRYYKVTKAGEEVLVHWLVPGDVFGLGTLLKHPPNYIGSGEALSDCDLLVWTHADIRKLGSTYPQLAENGLRITLHYLNGYADRHVGLVTRNAEDRLASALLNLAHRTGRVRPDGVEIEATNEQLGAHADISLFTTSKLLNDWERKGAVSKRRGRVLVRAPELLLAE